MRLAPQEKSKLKRLDIQGLRAVAVLAVIANHLTGQPQGGFVGVDVFFVVSGFVITTVMLREYRHSGRIGLANFYRHRIRRILPAAAVTLAVTVAGSAILYLPQRVQNIQTDAIWALLMAANWRFASDGTDYWDKGGPVSPLQHFWSLAVEEQFYFVWPVLVTFVLTVIAARRPTGRRALWALLAVLLTASFISCMLETADSPTWAYFSTSARAWEIGVGALVAVGTGAAERLSTNARTVLAAAGMAGLAMSLLLISSASAFPGPAALLPVISTALILAAGTGGAPRGTFILTNRPMTYVGDISYSLYLWHFPVIVLLAAVMPGRGARYYLLSVVITGTLSVLSYYVVEQAVLRSSWLAHGSGAADRPGVAAGGTQNKSRPPLGVYSAAAVTAVVLVAAITIPPGSLDPGPESADTSAGSVVGIPVPGMSQAELTTHLEAALARTEWPPLEPSVDRILTDTRPLEDNEGCGHTDLTKPDCTWNTGKAKTIVVLGDSTAITLLPTVRAAYGDSYNIRGMTMAGCAALDIQVKADTPQFAADCNKFKSDSVQEINRLKPAMVILSSTSEILAHLVSETPDDQAGAEWRQGTVNELKSLKPSGARLVVVTAPPLGKYPVDCATKFSKPSDCQYPVPTSHTLTAEAMRQAAASEGANFVDTKSWFCSAGQCPAFIGMTPLKRDNVHTTRQYAVLLDRVLRDAVEHPEN